MAQAATRRSTPRRGRVAAGIEVAAQVPVTPTGPRVALAISSFRSDDAAYALVEGALAEDFPFAAIVVVDSLGDGALGRRLAALDAQRVVYINGDRNLGSAGNLAARIAWAADAGMDWVLTVNHDGIVDATILRTMLAAAGDDPRLGAIYPLRRYVGAGGYLTAADRDLLRKSRFRSVAPSEPIVDVTWSSSNGALYATSPYHEGLEVWQDLWMGWEDLGYGLLLQRNGWRQIEVREACIDDGYEYKRVSIAGQPMSVTDKAPWYSYYASRNLLLIARRLGTTPAELGTFVGRIAAEFVAAATVRRDGLASAKLLLRGVVDGWRDQAGKGPVP